MNAIISNPDLHEGFSFTFDWFTGIYDCDDVSSFLEGLSSIDQRFKMDNFFSHKFGLYNYSFRIMLAGMPSISFAWNPDYSDLESLYNWSTVPKVDKVSGEVLIDNLRISSKVKSVQNPGLFISISGDGLRFLGADTVKRMFEYFHKNNVRATRLDVACDIKNRDNYIVPMLQSAFSNACQYNVGDYVLHAPHHQHTKFNTTLVARMQYDNLRKFNVINWQLGNHGSNFGMFRMYDKYFEISTGRHSDRAKEMLLGLDYWERLECELHHSAADQLFKSVCNGLPLSIAFGSAFSSLIRVSIGKTDGYKRSEFPTADDFTKFIDWLRQNDHFVQFVSEPFVDSTPEKFINHCLHMSSFLATFYELSQNIPGFYDMIDELAQKRKQMHPGKYSWVPDFIDKLVDEQRALS